MMLAACAALPVEAQSGFWHREGVAGGGQAARWADVAVDAAGRTHGVFVRDNGAGGTGIYYARKDGPNESWTGAWLVGGAGDAQRSQVSLVVDANGGLHASYVLRSGANSGQLFHASLPFGAASWSFVQVSSFASVHELAGTSIDVASNGLAAIAYTGLASNELRFASQASGGVWSDGIAAAAAQSGFAPSLDLIGFGFGDRVLVSHYDHASADLKLSRFVAVLTIPNTPPSWVTETVMAAGQAGLVSAVRRLPDGSTGVAYFQIDGDAMVRFGRKSGAFWTHETIDTATDESGDNPLVGYRLAMELDAVGAPMVTYAKGGFALLATVTEEIRHARRLDAGRWGIEPVRTGLATNTDATLAMATNGAGTPQVLLFTDVSDAPPTLEWLRPMAGAWVAENLNPLLPNSGPGRPLGPTAITHRGDEEFVLIHTVDSFEARNLRLIRTVGNSRQLIGGFPLFSCEQLAVARPRPGDGILFAARRNASSLDVWAISLADGSFITYSNPFNNVDAGSFDLAITPDGRLHLVLTRSGAVNYYRSRNPETSSPSFTFDPVPIPGNPSGAGASIAASEAGTVAISYRDTATDRLKLIAVSPGGVMGPAWTIDTPAGGFSGQSITHVCFQGETPYVAWAIVDDGNRSRVRVMTSNGLLFEEYPCRARVGTVRCAAAGGSITAAWFAIANAAENVPAHLGYGVCRGDGASESLLTVATPVPSSIWEANNAESDGFSLDLDASGFPKVTVVFSDITPPDNTEYLFHLQPADVLDADGDGHPLFVENAFAMNPAAANPGPPVLPDFPVMPSGEVRHRFSFNHSGLATPVRDGNSIRIGEFGFILSHSDDLGGFSREIGAGGITAGADATLPVSSTPPVSRSAFFLGYPAVYRETSPRHFTRLEFRRLGIAP